MGRFRRRLLAFPLPLVVCAAMAQGASAAARAGCTQGRTLLQGDQLRVFRSSRPSDLHVYGCLNGQRPIRHLGYANGMTRIAAAGHFFANGYSPVGGASEPVVVRNVRYARSLWHYYDSSPSACDVQCPPDYEHDPHERAGGVTSLVVTRGGRAAWIEGWRLPSGSTRFDVVTTVRPLKWQGSTGHRGVSETVDWGADIDPSSLHIAGTHVVWTKAGVKRSASLA